MRGWLLVMLVFCEIASADELPLYELGLGVAGISIPHYLGADQRHDVVLPSPYVIYRGERFRAGRRGAEAVLAGDQRLSLKLGFGFHLPVRSGENRARAGMPSLNPLLEVGPELQYSLLGDDKAARQLSMTLPLRGAISVDDFSVENKGWLASPEVAWRRRYDFWQMAASFSILYGDQRYQGYFYDVEDRFATSERPAFSSSSGVMGTRLRLSASYRFSNIRLGGFAQFYSLQAAENKSSPLIKRDSDLSVGLFFAWILHQSTASAPYEPYEE